MAHACAWQGPYQTHLELVVLWYAMQMAISLTTFAAAGPNYAAAGGVHLRSSCQLLCVQAKQQNSRASAAPSSTPS